MDYVKETLERQSALWRALLSGGGSDASAQEDAEQLSMAAGGGEAAASLFPAGKSPAAAPEESTAAARPLPERIETAQRESGESAETGAELALLQYRKERLLTELRLPGGTETAEAEAAGGKMTRGAETVAAESAPWETEVVLRQGSGELETADARAISRRFERDARRYDGGFIFY